MAETFSTGICGEDTDNLYLSLTSSLEETVGQMGEEELLKGLPPPFHLPTPHPHFSLQAYGVGDDVDKSS